MGELQQIPESSILPSLQHIHFEGFGQLGVRAGRQVIRMQWGWRRASLTTLSISMKWDPDDTRAPSCSHELLLIYGVYSRSIVLVKARFPELPTTSMLRHVNKVFGCQFGQPSVPQIPSLERKTRAPHYIFQYVSGPSLKTVILGWILLSSQQI